MEFEGLLETFVKACREILGENLVGVYLHGSAVMGCFHPEKSDLDLLVVVKREVADGVKRDLMEAVVACNGSAPAKGLEMSVVRQSVCKPFQYPTPFELHFSNAHLDWYKTDPEGYVEKMKGTDKDLAAHVTILNHRGRALYGRPVAEVFGEVPKKAYLDSIWEDVRSAREEIAKDPVYLTLNLCRVLAFVREGLILSKKEGGEWGLAKLPEEFSGVSEAALESYASEGAMAFEMEAAVWFADFTVREIGTAV